MNIYNNGTFEGKGIGYAGDINVKVVITEGKIEDIIIISHNETPIISDPAFAHLPKNIVEANTILVPNVKGCSMSSRGIREAVANALILSGEDKEKTLKDLEDSELLEKLVLNKVKAKKVETFDVVIVGAGGAGLSAAISASTLGAKVVVLEKMAAIGGNTLVSMGGVNIPGNDAQVSKKIEDSAELHFQDALAGGDGENNQELLRIISENALATYNWLKDTVGVEFKKDELLHFGGHSVPRAAVFKGTYAVELITKLRQKALDLGVEIRTEVTAKEIILNTKKDKVIGIKANIDGKNTDFYTKKGVIFATGGFSGNVEMRKKYNPEFDERYKTTNQSGITGDGHIMCESIGVDFVHMSYIQTFPIADPTSGALSHVGGSRLDGAILVNKSGKRFVEELERRDVVSNGILSQEGGVGYLVWDQKVDTIAHRTAENKSEVDRLKRNNLFFEGSLEEVAEQSGIDFNTLEETLDRYNSDVKNGKDTEFNRRGNLVEISEGPYYVQVAAPAIHHTMGGVKVNSTSEVLDTDGNTITGLYAAGEIVGGIHGTNRLGGNAITDILVFGKRVGENIMK